MKNVIMETIPTVMMRVVVMLVAVEKHHDDEDTIDHHERSMSMANVISKSQCCNYL